MAVNLEQILTNSASGLSAESIRMNTIASNLANAGSVGSTEESTYHSNYPIFSEVTNKISGLSDSDQPSAVSSNRCQTNRKTITKKI